MRWPWSDAARLRPRGQVRPSVRARLRLAVKRTRRGRNKLPVLPGEPAGAETPREAGRDLTGGEGGYVQQRGRGGVKWGGGDLKGCGGMRCAGPVSKSVSRGPSVEGAAQEWPMDNTLEEPLLHKDQRFSACSEVSAPQGVMTRNYLSCRRWPKKAAGSGSEGASGWTGGFGRHTFSARARGHGVRGAGRGRPGVVGWAALRAADFDGTTPWLISSARTKPGTGRTWGRW